MNTIESNFCKIGLALHITHTKVQLHRQLDKVLSAHGIGVSELMVLHALHTAQGALSRIALADMLSLSASAITKLLAPMEKIGLVDKAKDAHDARLSLVLLTDAGTRVYQEALVTARAELDYYFARLTSEELALLARLLEKI